MRWMPILVTCVCIIIRCKPTGISTLNVRVCEGNSKTRHKLERNLKNLPGSTQLNITELN
ncbi:hypothetical protein MTR67_007643 [Solanum verrucosum]|uniref:Uncharacterized protein n=1 Tax=Solanum verrucosum TaxID=315347 RepID=A0AAF0TFA7_SOLVR|nr:hypothetical protein MTR67_007643 [Solanum verrucosum]